jgi:hypothetical protein
MPEREPAQWVKESSHCKVSMSDWGYRARLPEPGHCRRRPPAVNPATEISVWRIGAYGNLRSRIARVWTTTSGRRQASLK